MEIDLTYKCTGMHSGKRGVAIGGFHFRSKNLGGQDFTRDIEVPVKLFPNGKGREAFRNALGQYVKKELGKGGKQVLEIKNPARIEITISDEEHKPSYLVEHPELLMQDNWTAYELATIHAKGYGPVPPRDVFEQMEQYSETSEFLNALKNEVKENREYVKGGYFNMKWENIRDNIVNAMYLCMASGRFHFAPLSEKTKKERQEAGWSPDPPMFASGRLAECIVGDIIYGTNEEVPF